MQTQVAVKLLHAEISQDAEAIQRLFNEARSVGRIKHAGIVKRASSMPRTAPA